MSKKEFMEELEVLLGELPADEREEALSYYDSYFAEAGEENEQVVLNELGSAGRVATQILRDFRGAKGDGFYTESGYQEQEPAKASPVKYAGDTQGSSQNGTYSEDYRQTTSDGSGVHVTKKGLSGGSLVLVILLLVITFPVWIAILFGGLGVLIGLVCGFGGLLIGLGVAGAVGAVMGIILFFAALAKLLITPIIGAAFLAAAFLCFGAGCLMMAVVQLLVQFAVWLVKAVTGGLSRMFHGNKEAVV